MRGALALLLICTTAWAQELRCPQTVDGPKTAALVAGAVRVGPAEDRVELAGGDMRQTRNGYEIVYHFPGHEEKWLMCAYGNDGEIQRFLPMSGAATECKLRVRESKRAVSARMTCK